MRRREQLKAALLALILGVLFLGPALLPGRALLPEDPRGFSPLREQVSAAELSRIDAESVPHRRDRLLQFLPFDVAVGEAWANGRVPLWEPRVLCGLPLLAQTTSRAFYPTAFLFALFSPESLYAWIYLLHLVFGGWAIYRLSRILGAEEQGALLADASFVLSGYAVAHVHHPMIFFAAVWILPALELTFSLMRRGAAGIGNRRPGTTAALLALCIAMSWLAGFSQASLLLCYLVVGLTVFLAAEDVRCCRPVPWRSMALIGVGLVLGVGLALVQILPAIQAARHSARSAGWFDLLAGRALPVTWLVELVLPGQFAEPGDLCPVGPERPRPTFLALLLSPASKAPALNSGVFNHTETALGFGVWPLLFAISTVPMLFRRIGEGSSRWILGFLWTATLVGLLGAMAFPGLTHLLLLLPGFAVGDLKRLLVLPALCLPLLAGIGWREVRGNDLVRMLVPAGIALLLGVWFLSSSDPAFTARFGNWLGWRYGESAPAAFEREVLTGEAGMNRLLLARGLAILGLVLALPTLLLRLRRLSAWTFVLVTAIELLPVAWSASPAPGSGALRQPLPLLPPKSAAQARLPTRLLRLEPAATANAPVRLLPPNLPLVWDLADLAGYAPLPPRRTEAFFAAIDPDSVSGGAGVRCLRNPQSLRSPLIQLLAPDYLLTTEIDPPLTTGPLRGWSKIASTGGVHIFGRSDGASSERKFDHASSQSPAFARLYFSYRVLPPAELAERLAAPGFDPRTELLLENEPDRPHRGTTGSADRAMAKLVSYEPGEIRVRYRSPDPCFLFVAEAWAPGWHYEGDDGSQGQTLPAQLMFQAVPVPAGEHELRLVYAPSSFRVGGVLSLLALVGLVLCALLRPRPRAAARSSP